MAREARAAMADHRAMMIESNRENPRNVIRGRGATPSMGLSQFRGGGKREAAMEGDMSEAFGQGRHLYSHLHGLHGAGYAEDFKKGMSGGSRSGATEGQGKKFHIMPDGSRMEGATHGGDHCEDSDSDMEGGRKMASTPHYEDEVVPVNDEAVLRRRKRATGGKKPLMEGDGRLARAKIVKQVMAKRGCSMIEASKYVKEHNLYKK